MNTEAQQAAEAASITLDGFVTIWALLGPSLVAMVAAVWNRSVVREEREAHREDDRGKASRDAARTRLTRRSDTYAETLDSIQAAISAAIEISPEMSREHRQEVEERLAVANRNLIRAGFLLEDEGKRLADAVWENLSSFALKLAGGTPKAVDPFDDGYRTAFRASRDLLAHAMRDELRSLEREELS